MNGTERRRGKRRRPARAGLLLAAVVAACAVSVAEEDERRTSFLLITADDLNCDSVGAYGSRVPDITPNIDRLASEGLRLEYAHVTIAVCQPCRSVWLTGRYPHQSGGEGFHTLRVPGVPTLPALLRSAGYRVGILGKGRHSTPYPDFEWDARFEAAELGGGRSPSLYGERAKKFIADSVAAKRPFFLMANSHDPHRPFHNAGPPRKGAEPPTRVYTPGEVVVPGFLPDLPEVRLEISEYFSSVRRCDDTVGAVLRALEESGHAGNTLVMFLSDHGMALPFAKTNCYLHSTRTPWIVRWPGRVPAGSVDREHMISGVDLTPTVLDALKIEQPSGLAGRSFLPVLRGGTQSGRDMVFTQFHQTSARRAYPMRCVLTKRFGYIWNPWADGERVFRNESQSGRTMKAMRAAAEDDPALRARVTLFLERVPEELYDFANDPDALENLAGDATHREELDRLRRRLLEWMERTGDPALAAFRQRDSTEAREAFVRSQEERAGTRERRRARKSRRKSDEG